MNTLIFDCGATKCTIVHIINGIYQNHKILGGFNAAIKNDVEAECKTHFSELPKQYNVPDLKIEFCGAGCSADEIIIQVRNALQCLFPKAQVSISDDLSFIPHVLGIDEKCIIGIMGTGSNAGYWDGNAMHNEMSGGYLIGDEGSAFRIGQKVIAKYIRNDFDADTMAMLFQKIGLDKKALISKVYRSKEPNKLIASYATVVSDLPQKESASILNNELSEFVEKRIKPLKNKAQVVHLFGSVAYFNIEYLRPPIEELNLQVGMIAKGPLDLLIRN